jgi:hypothetical protein
MSDKPDPVLLLLLSELRQVNVNLKTLIAALNPPVTK